MADHRHAAESVIIERFRSKTFANLFVVDQTEGRVFADKLACFTIDLLKFRILLKRYAVASIDLRTVSKISNYCYGSNWNAPIALFTGSLH